MAHGGSPVVVSGRTKPGLIINRFRAFLERLSLEIDQDQLQALKFLLGGIIPLGILERCLTPRQLFTRMMQQSLLGEDHLDNLQQLFTQAQRSDLAEHVRVFKQSLVEVESELPGNGNIAFASRVFPGSANREWYCMVFISRTEVANLSFKT